jgi:hypothetical protein
MFNHVCGEVYIPTCTIAGAAEKRHGGGSNGSARAYANMVWATVGLWGLKHHAYLPAKVSAAVTLPYTALGDLI